MYFHFLAVVASNRSYEPQVCCIEATLSSGWLFLLCRSRYEQHWDSNTNICAALRLQLFLQQSTISQWRRSSANESLLFYSIPLYIHNDQNENSACKKRQFQGQPSERHCQIWLELLHEIWIICQASTMRKLNPERQIRVLASQAIGGGVGHFTIFFKVPRLFFLPNYSMN